MCLRFWSQLLSTFYTSPVFIHTIIAVKPVANTALCYHIGGIPFIIFFASTAYELNILRHLSTSLINVFMLHQGSLTFYLTTLIQMSTKKIY